MIPQDSPNVGDGGSGNLSVIAVIRANRKFGIDMTMIQLDRSSVRARKRQRQREAWANVLNEYPPMCPVVVTITTPTLPAAARKTLQRLFLTDKAVRHPLEVRAAHFRAKPKRRGGRHWVKRPNALRLKLRVDDKAEMKLTPEARRALSSVSQFVKLERAATSLVVPTDGVAVPHRLDARTQQESTATGKGVDAMDCVWVDDPDKRIVLKVMNRRQAAEEQRLRPIFASTATVDAIGTIECEVKPVIRERVLHTSMAEHPRRRQLAKMIDAHEVTDVYLDISDAQACEPQTLLAFAAQLHRMIASLGALAHPLVVGPLARRQRELRRSFALVQVRTTAYDFDHYCSNIHHRRASSRRPPNERPRD